MLLKTFVAIVAALAVSTPALADHGRRDYGYGNYARHPVVHVKHRYYHYRPVPQRVVVVHRPQPVYYQRVDPHTGALIVVGALLGAVIGHQIATGY
jgi:uncharacterized protein YcfJ